MKNWYIYFVAMMAIYGLGCNRTTSKKQVMQIGPADAQCLNCDTLGTTVRMNMIQNHYPLDTKNVYAILLNPKRKSLIFGGDWTLQKWENGSWMGAKMNGMYGFGDVGMQLNFAPDYYCFSYPVSCYRITSGKYRIIQSFHDGRTENCFTEKYYVMRTKLLLGVLAWFAACTLQAQEVNDRYIEVTGTSEIEIVPDKIHYLIEIREYFEEEFDGKSKSEEYRTKVPLGQIEQQLWKVLIDVGIPKEAVRTQEVGDYWRRQGQDFLVSKKYDITLTDFKQIDEIVKRIDTRGVNTMRIGELENKDMLVYHQKGKIEALKAAQRKATYLVEALGKKLGAVIRIVEDGNIGMSSLFSAQSNVRASDAASFDGFRTIKRHYSMQVRFEITD